MKRTATLLVLLALGACGQHADEQHVSAAATTADASAAHENENAIYAAAVANEARPEGDRARDAGRKPAQVLEFLGIKPGMTVLDMFSGGGYYTEIIAHLVGDNGHVIAQSNEAYMRFAGEEFENRYLGGRLENAEVLMAENNELSLSPDSVDAITLILSFHDLYYDAPDAGWPAFDIPALLAELYNGLKTGGIVGVVDHAAAAGAPSETGVTTHRIDPAIVIEEMTAAGFVLDGQSDLLRNPDDDYDVSVFSEAVRGTTDRFLLRFRKPE